MSTPEACPEAELAVVGCAERWPKPLKLLLLIVEFVPTLLA